MPLDEAGASPHQFDSLTRRDFVGGITKAALALALAGSWRFEARAASTPGSGSHAMNPLAPLRGTLGTPAPTAGPFTNWRYRWVFNRVSRTPQSASISDIGSLQIRRTASPEQVEYNIEQKRLFGDYEATLVCGNEPGEPMREWRTRQVTDRRDAEPLISIVEGRVSGSEVEITRGQIREKIALSGPLHSEIPLLVSAANLQAVAKREITLLEGGAMVRPGVLVRRDSDADTALDGVSAAAWLMTGRGLMPAHFMVDESGRGLCRTLFTTSLVLEEANA